MRILIIISYRLDINRYHDGFNASIQLIKNLFLNTDNVINVINLHYTNLNDHLKKHTYDIGLIKSTFGSGEKHAKTLKNNNILTGLFISSINKPNLQQLNCYDVLFYETEWYRKFSKLNRHKNIFHAFGVDTDIMKNKNLEKVYDIISVGTFAEYKRYHKLKKLPGKKIAIGHFYGKSNNPIILSLKKNNVEVKDYVKYDILCNFYNKSKLCYVPCKINGGGERAVLEARACETEVKIENDNDKLKELIESPIYDHIYYAKQIIKGVKVTINKSIINRGKDNDSNNNIRYIYIDNTKFKMYNTNLSDAVLRNIHLNLGWEAYSIRLWYLLSKSADIIIDIGSYTGIYSIISSLVNNKNIHAFEINNDNYNRIKENLKLNNKDNVEVHMKGISNKDGIMYCNNHKPLVNRGLCSVHNLTDKKTNTKIETITIDTFLKTKKYNNILIKIDTEETEIDVIDGMHNTITNYYPDIIIECFKVKKINYICNKYPNYNCFLINDYDLRIETNINIKYPKSRNFLLTTKDLNEINILTKQIYLI